ncbi:hypothetical protein EXIGLDRAFT_650153 [Exidia glandulosa HHB12029]|uniref:Peptidase S33 tripeptidyl aminopeptidase-like C-terminal domain-containing protein n=1 Tax=Exidia glandulosa HHB12029 TaxID=1314781 RepID=A0A165FTH3_EXIGL|nr:hypothetical protein EXIGLDRAFT_650153 [Exidia glandulosa HHB12029]
MEKSSAVYEPLVRPAPARAPKMSMWTRVRSVLFYCVLAYWLYFLGSIWVYLYQMGVDERASWEIHNLADAFDWNKLPPSETLEWVRCYEEPFQCARLMVPLNYAKPHMQKAAVALIKYPAKYPVGHEKWRGPILFNPGGPGGSGVDTIHARGANMSKIIGDDFDMIGFDPRGIGRTRPKLAVLESESERMTWQLQLPPPINVTVDALAKIYGYWQIMADLVVERQAHAAAHMSTAIVARDMLQITKAHGRDKLQYWGFSYGTVLGITFSAMFPDNVGRVIVDGVADTENYYSGAWDNNLLDTDKDLATVLESCAASSVCPLREKTGDLVGNRLDAILNNLKTEPIPVRNGSIYGLVDYSLAHSLIFRALYKPVTSFPPLFAALAEVEKGNGQPLYTLSGITTSSWRCECSSGGGALPESVGETTAAIACGDADVVDHDLPQLKEHYANMARLSSFADVWHVHAHCAAWKIRPVERFNGPFVGNTSFPMLFIGNTADPVTPLWAAKKMSKGFKDAVVLTQNSPGHCSTAATSLCTSKYIRAYFRNGTLPEPGTVCEDDDDIFPPDDKVDIDLAALSAEDRELLRAARDFSAGFEVPRLGFI